jgi:hypothetical protein
VESALTGKESEIKVVKRERERRRRDLIIAMV